MPGLELKIVDSEDMTIEMPQDGEAQGELLARGPWITGDYYKLPEEDREGAIYISLLYIHYYHYHYYHHYYYIIIIIYIVGTKSQPTLCVLLSLVRFLRTARAFAKIGCGQMLQGKHRPP